MSVFKKLTDILKEKKLHISSAESCTGGLFMSSVIDHPGTSSVVDGSFVTYSPEMKTALVNVSPETISAFGVVSEEVAREMARGSAEKTSADVSVGITGNAGPTLGDVSKELGMVCFGIYIKGRILSYTEYFDNMSRNEIRRAAADFAAEKLIEALNNS